MEVELRLSVLPEKSPNLVAGSMNRMIAPHRLWIENAIRTYYSRISDTGTCVLVW